MGGQSHPGQEGTWERHSCHTYTHTPYPHGYRAVSQHYGLLFVTGLTPERLCVSTNPKFVALANAAIASESQDCYDKVLLADNSACTSHCFQVFYNAASNAPLNCSPSEFLDVCLAYTPPCTDQETLCNGVSPARATGGVFMAVRISQRL